MNSRNKGIYAASLSAIFLGLAPVFGRQAILLGLPSLAVVALRTIFAAFLMLIVLLVFQRKFLYIYPAGLLGCIIAGGINGLGSLLFYGALERIDASIGQMLNSTYPLFVALWLALDHQPLSRLTMFRLGLSLPAILLLTQTATNDVDLLGMGMMLGAAALYALHLPINQRVLFDMPAPTVTLYTLFSMSAIVVPAFLIFGDITILSSTDANWGPVIGLTLVTFLSRITLFLGVKNLGGMQTAIIGLGELLVTVLIAIFWLGESLSILQWVGAALLFTCVVLVGFEKNTQQRRSKTGIFRWLRPPTELIELTPLPLPPTPTKPKKARPESPPSK